MKVGLAPIADEHASVLILGSLPGDLSLQKQQYYATPRNHFWAIMAAILKEPLPKSYPSRVQMLQRHRVALWDVINRAEREGSLDAGLREKKPNDLAEFLDRYPNIQFILLNGSEAYRSYQKYFGTLNVPNAMVRSSSPVPSRECNTLQEKTRQWKDVWERYAAR
ncbi:MAG: DNA-deoxyinosine glycosylase [Oscillospiraceae bacterium]